MRKKISKEIIIKLILDDLKHLHVVSGLNMLGFKKENALLEIPITIFFLMKLNNHDKRLDHLINEYTDRAYKVVEIAYNDSESFDRLATEIYNWLFSEHRKYMKLLSNT